MATALREEEVMNGTVFPAEPFDKDADAKALYDATKIIGTKEKVIIDILAKRTNTQRQDIADAYSAAYNADLLAVMRSELSGDFLSVVEGLLDEPALFLAKCIHRYATDTSILPTTDLALRLLEIIFPLNYMEIGEIKEVYYQAFGTLLEEDLITNVYGPWVTILLNVVEGHRHETAKLDETQVDEDVQYLVETPIDEWALPNTRIEDILIKDSLTHLSAVFAKCKELMSAKDINLTDAINGSTMITTQKDGFLIVVDACLDYVSFNASSLHRAIAGIGTDDDTLIRLVVSRCEIDLANIKSVYAEIYSITLRDSVSGDTSGDYRDILLAIIG